MKDIIISTTQLLDLLKITATTLHRWQRAGMPPPLKRGTWRFNDIFEWWQDKILSSKAEDKDKDINAVKLEYWSEKTRNERLKADKTEGELISKSEVAHEWSVRLSEVASGLQSLSMRLPPLLEGKKQSDMRQIIDAEQKKIRDNYYRTGRFSSQGEDEDDADE